MKTIKSADIFAKEKLRGLANELSSQGKNILVFGLPYSGKSTLVKAVCHTNKRFKTLDEEEILSENDMAKVLETKGVLWCVGHQYPSQNQGVSDKKLAEFAIKMGLKPDLWVFARIIK